MLGRLLGVGIASCSDCDTEGVWMIGTYVAKVWENIYIRGGSRLKEEQFFGFFKFKYKLAQECGPVLRRIPNLLG